jgi:hypothetical protein
VAESDARRVAAVLAADAELQLRRRGAALLDGDAHERAGPALAIDRLEGVAR